MSLWKLCSLGNVGKVRAALATGRDVNSRSAENQTLLMLLATQSSKNHLSILRLMLEQPSTELNLADDVGNTALHMATISKNIEAVKILLADQRININCCANSEKVTPLIIAAEKADNIDIFKLLMADHRVDVNWGYRMTALLMASACFNIEATRLLLDDPRVDVNQISSIGYSALHVASLQGNTDAARLVLELFLTNPRVDVNCRTAGPRVKSALDVALASNNVEGVKLILAEPRLSSLEGQKGFETVRIAVSQGNGDLLKELVYHQNIDLGVKDEDGLGLDDLIR